MSILCLQLVACLQVAAKKAVVELCEGSSSLTKELKHYKGGHQPNNKYNVLILIYKALIIYLRKPFVTGQNPTFLSASLVNIFDIFYKQLTPVWEEQPQVAVSPGVSGKHAPEACWVSLWTVCHHCTLDPVNKITQGKHNLVHIDIESQINLPIKTHTNLHSVVAMTNTVNFLLLAKHGLPGGCRHQSQTLLQKAEWNGNY